jgi:hypothetical protein
MPTADDDDTDQDDGIATKQDNSVGTDSGREDDDIWEAETVPMQSDSDTVTDDDDEIGIKEGLQLAYDALPHISATSQLSLEQVQKLQERTRSFLRDIGRQKDETGMNITLRKGYGLNNPAIEPVRFGNFTLSAAYLKLLATSAHVRFLPVRGLTASANVLFPQKFRDHRVRPDDDNRSQAVAVVGPVLVVHDYEKWMGKEESLFDLKQRGIFHVQCVSVPAINFSYDKHDQDMFIDRVSGRIYKDKALKRMEEITHLFMSAFRDVGVKYPVLCAIGCGAFKGPFQEIVPRLWATAMKNCLKRRDYGFHLVVISIPEFEPSGEANLKAFRAVFNEKTRVSLPVKVHLTEKHSMVTVARSFREMGLPSGILNPSDAQAVRGGFMGMYWDEGPFALEEMLAMQTTLLLQHRGVNPELYTDSKRWKPVSPLDQQN